MKPIDADELKKHAVETYQANGVELEPIMMVPLSVINNAPTVERPQGEWIVNENDDIFNSKKCSICKNEAEWLDGGSQFLSKFCPNCGAQMKGSAK